MIHPDLSEPTENKYPHLQTKKITVFIIFTIQSIPEESSSLLVAILLHHGVQLHIAVQRGLLVTL